MPLRVFSNTGLFLKDINCDERTRIAVRLDNYSDQNYIFNIRVTNAAHRDYDTQQAVQAVTMQ